MKKPVYYLLFLISFPFVFGCNQNTSESKKDKAEAKADSLKKSDCFQAVDGRDTANLKIKTLSNGKITGRLVINYLDKGKNDGLVEGSFKGDTLYMDYSFKIGTSNPTQYKNPLAFLKKDGHLVMGVGQILTTLGKSYFAKDKPINFERGRFVFVPADCKD